MAVLCPDMVETSSYETGGMNKDRWGPYQSLTGHEGPNRCFWCGGEARGKRYCCQKHQWEYYRHFFWPYARDWCLERYGGRCTDCGDPALEAHHIEPLNGEPRHVNIKNRPENLVALCYSCHGKRHAAVPIDGRLEKAPDKIRAKDGFAEAVGRGQLVLLEV